MSKKIIVLCGISGSGKSTFAHKQFVENPQGVVLVNRDKIRELLFGFTEESIQYYYDRSDVGKLEKQVTLFEDTLIHDGLNLDKTVIVDATHLEQKYLQRYKFWNVPVEFVYFSVTLEEAVDRDRRRVRQVGVDVIKKQYDKFINLQRQGAPVKFEPIEFKQNRNLPPVIIYDIDGTIAEKGNRSAFDWKAVGRDLVIQNVTATMDWVNDLSDKDRPTVIICTGRDAVCRFETIQWLADNELAYDNIYFRPEGDQRPDWIVKEEMWRNIARTNYIVGMYDDRNQVTRRARALGLKVFQVEYGNF